MQAFISREELNQITPFVRVYRFQYGLSGAVMQTIFFHFLIKAAANTLVGATAPKKYIMVKILKPFLSVEIYLSQRMNSATAFKINFNLFASTNSSDI